MKAGSSRADGSLLRQPMRISRSLATRRAQPQSARLLMSSARQKVTCELIASACAYSGGWPTS
eukprot:6653588-Prymnesium_polylepis.1